MKIKRVFLIILISLIFLTSLPLVLSEETDITNTINLEIEKKAINDAVINELDKLAVFNLTIKNLGPSDEFEIYSLAGVEMSPKSAFQIPRSGIKTLTVKAKVQETIKEKVGKETREYFKFTYKIKGKKSGIQEDELVVRMMPLKEVFNIKAEDIMPDDDFAIIYLKNKENIDFNKVKTELSSALFSSTDEFSLNAYEKKEIRVDLNKKKIKKLVAGVYVLTAEIAAEGIEIKIEETVNFNEKKEITTTEEKSGVIILKKTIRKTNDGNLPVIAQINIKRNIISRLLTTYNTESDKAERIGAFVYYTWKKELQPGDVMEIKSSTNLIFPLLLVIVVIIIAVLVRIYTTTNLVLRKKVSFVKTKGGEFALKVILTVSARKYVEKISVIDRLPPLVKIYERFGALKPDKINEKTRRIEWDIENMHPGETRVFSYIIYSKIGVTGRFVLPRATAIYEREGKIQESESNEAFFVAEQRESLDD